MLTNNKLIAIAISAILVIGIVGTNLVVYAAPAAKEVKTLNCNVPNSCKGIKFEGKNMDVEVQFSVSVPPSGAPVTNNTELLNKITSLENDISGLQSTVQSQQAQLDNAKGVIANLSATNVLTDVSIIPNDNSTSGDADN